MRLGLIIFVAVFVCAYLLPTKTITSVSSFGSGEMLFGGETRYPVTAKASLANVATCWLEGESCWTFTRNPCIGVSDEIKAGRWKRCHFASRKTAWISSVYAKASAPESVRYQMVMLDGLEPRISIIFFRCFTVTCRSASRCSNSP